jgi:hypothetical protein
VSSVFDGVITADTDLLKPVYYFSPLLDRQKMEETIGARFDGSAHRIFPPGEGLKRMSVMREFGYAGLMWDQLVRFPKQRG